MGNKKRTRRGKGRPAAEEAAVWNQNSLPAIHFRRKKKEDRATTQNLGLRQGGQKRSAPFRQKTRLVPQPREDPG